MKKQYLELHVLVLIFGFTAILGKLTSSSALVVVFYRTLIAFLGLYVVNRVRNIKLSVSKEEVIKLMAVGLILGLHWLAFFGSGKLANVSVSLVTFGLTSFFTALLEPIFTDKKLQKTDLFYGLLGFAGVCIIFGYEITYFWGLVVGILSSVLAAMFSIFNSRLTFKYESTIISFYELLSSCILMGCILIAMDPGLTSFSISVNDLGWIAILALVCTVYPHAKMISLMRNIDVFTANLSLNLEPIYGIVLAYLIFGDSEKMSPSFYLGAFLVVISVFLNAFQKYYTKKRALIS